MKREEFKALLINLDDLDPDEITDWESNFIGDMYEKFVTDERWPPTPNQGKKIISLQEKYL